MHSCSTSFFNCAAVFTAAILGKRKNITDPTSPHYCEYTSTSLPARSTRSPQHQHDDQNIYYQMPTINDEQIELYRCYTYLATDLLLTFHLSTEALPIILRALIIAVLRSRFEPLVNDDRKDYLGIKNCLRMWMGHLGG
ncbi:hypothetical protein VTL71DRAFT_6490 [Oculimacula yallundae]|uniref:Uncharacterized protein n=1 Tax=Oculimacula yallundae TaxID=86028 RepID=A0ABR4BYT5_9HELO